MKEKMKSTRIFDETTGLETGVELVAQHIESIATSLAKIAKSRVSRKLILALIHDDTKLNKGTIELVLNSLDNLEQRYLSKKVKL